MTEKSKHQWIERKLWVAMENFCRRWFFRLSFQKGWLSLQGFIPTMDLYSPRHLHVGDNPQAGSSPTSRPQMTLSKISMWSYFSNNFSKKMLKIQFGYWILIKSRRGKIKRWEFNLSEKYANNAVFQFSIPNFQNVRKFWGVRGPRPSDIWFLLLHLPFLKLRANNTRVLQ